MVKMLLEAGVDVLFLNNAKKKAIDFARHEVVKNLLQEAEDRIICHGFKRAKTVSDDDDDDEEEEEEEDQQS
jgi:hypothetical protein